jgi:hypothetical protein
MINTNQELRNLGFDGELLQIDDTIKDMNDKTALDRFLDSCLSEAGFWIMNLIGSIYTLAHTDLLIQPKIKQAELLVSQVGCINQIMLNSTKLSEDLKIEGIEVKKNFNKENYLLTIQTLYDRANNLLSEFLVNASKIRVVNISV